MRQLEILPAKIEAEIVDPRRTSYGHVLHSFSAIIVIALLATLCGVRSYFSMEQFARFNRTWLSKFINLGNGIPDSDTIRRCLERIDPRALAYCLYEWLGVFGLAARFIHIDGKTICGSGNYQTKAKHILTAFSSDLGAVLAEMVVLEKNNEIIAVQFLLNDVKVAGAMVTTDAIMCQRGTCGKIIACGGHYCLALKGNQPSLLENVTLLLDKGDDIQTDAVYEKGHGRVECREYRFTSNIDGLDPEGKWPGLRAVGSVTRTYEEKGEITSDTRHFILSVTDFGLFKESTRAHWSIENGLHWSLDMIYGEDACTAKKGNAPLNRNILRKTSLNLLDTGQKSVDLEISRPALLDICKYNKEVIEALVNKESLMRFFAMK